jgi:hypothetical protein
LEHRGIGVLDHIGQSAGDVALGDQCEPIGGIDDDTLDDAVLEVAVEHLETRHPGRAVDRLGRGVLAAVALDDPLDEHRDDDHDEDGEQGAADESAHMDPSGRVLADRREAGSLSLQRPLLPE